MGEEQQRSDDERGLYSKYQVTHTDGRPLDGDCFVLRPDRDPAAWHALEEYIRYTQNGLLAGDILLWLHRIGHPGDPREILISVQDTGRRLTGINVAMPLEYGIAEIEDAISALREDLEALRTIEEHTYDGKSGGRTGT